MTLSGIPVPPPPASPLAAATTALLGQAIELYRDSPSATGWLHRHAPRFGEPLRLAVVGPRGCGKSTLVNAIVGELVAPLEVGGAPVMSAYRAGQAPRAVVHSPLGPPWELPLTRSEQRLHIDAAHLAGLAAEPIDRIDVDWPSRSLRGLTLVDTPAADAADPHAVQGIGMAADALLYLVRQPVDEELGLLRAVHDHPIAMAYPVGSLIVLSRADELGGGRIDAVISARQVARRFRRAAGPVALGQDVHAVAGLLACAGRTLTEPEFAALAELARLSRKELDAALLSADRFTLRELPVSLDRPTRELLLARYGMFGLRLATTLIRQGSDTVPALAAELSRRSGLGELRDSIETQFTERQDVLKARSALIALEVVLRMEPRPAAARLAAELDRVLAGAHEFAELRLLGALRSGRCTLPAELAEDAVRLLGGLGTTPSARLGADYELSDGEVEAAGADAVRRWREHAESPLFGARQRAVAAGVVRSCEALVAPEPAYG